MTAGSPHAGGRRTADGDRALRVVIAGGGTGGHLFPGIAVAEEIRARQPAHQILFISRGNEFERSALARAGFPLTAITVEGFKGRGLWNQLRMLANLPRGFAQSVGVLREFRPELVVGLGSYAAGPVVLAAWTMRIPIALCEQNTLPGITNRALARFADRIFTSFERTAGGFDPRKVVWTGNPLRREILTAAPPADGRRADRFTVLVLGGSQGAHRLNTAMAEALERLERPERFAFIHQTGAADETAVAEAYRRAGARAQVQAFFHDMAEPYRAADLVVCRAGATTVAEITALGKAAVYVPFPFAADDHQRLNAGQMVAAGAAEMIDEAALTGEVLAERIHYYAGRPEVLRRMAERSAALGRPDAAARIVDECYRLLAGSARRAADRSPHQRADGPTG
jgi:UDP-N-acetylglucosamine--N-acetylmuramyl-(pentapeptide) pyrophosphoryl-undecaprenol N-acetylglucosamine transferase